MLCSMWFRYNIDRMPQELNSYLRQLAYGKTGFISPQFQEPINDIKWGLNYTAILKPLTPPSKKCQIPGKTYKLVSGNATIFLP